MWYIDDPFRFRAEKAHIASLAAEAPWLRLGRWRLDAELRLLLDMDIVVDEEIFPVSLRYPGHFPHSPPMVLPRGAEERWSGHQYGAGGELCLEWGPDNWHPDVSGADMLASAHRLLETERSTPGVRTHAPSRHALSLGQELRYKPIRFVITRAFAAFLDTLADGECLGGKVISNFREVSASYIPASVTGADGGEWMNLDVPRVLASEFWERPMVVLRWPASQALPTTTSAKDFFDVLAAQSCVVPLESRPGCVVIAHGNDIRALTMLGEGDAVCALSVVPPQVESIRLDEDHRVLSARSVGIVGCGSLGSKLAVMLARGGVGQFLLVDDDLILPDNLVRHQLDWRDVGMHKAEALARAVGLASASATCRTRLDRLGGQEASGNLETLIDVLARCDLIIDATADARVFNLLTATAEIGKKPLVWAEVFGGGIGGLIARHRPGIEPDPATMRVIIEAWCVNKGKPIERAEIDYAMRAAGPPLIADDADVSVIAAHAARFAIDILIGRDPSLFPYAVYMIGLANDWNFDQPFETHPIDVGVAAPKEPVAVKPDLQAEEKAHIVEMLSALTDAPPTPASDS